jgi:hypothetical protein
VSPLTMAQICLANFAHASRRRVVASEIRPVPGKSWPCLEDFESASRRRAVVSMACVIASVGAIQLSWLGLHPNVLHVGAGFRLERRSGISWPWQAVAGQRSGIPAIREPAAGMDTLGSGSSPVRSASLFYAFKDLPNLGVLSLTNF